MAGGVSGEREGWGRVGQLYPPGGDKGGYFAGDKGGHEHRGGQGGEGEVHGMGHQIRLVATV